MLQQSLQILRADVWVSKLMASPHCSASSYGRCCAYALSDHKPRTMLRHDDSYKLNKCTLDVFAAVLAWPGRSSAQTRDCKAAVISSLLGQTQTSFGQSLNTHSFSSAHKKSRRTDSLLAIHRLSYTLSTASSEPLISIGVLVQAV